MKTLTLSVTKLDATSRKDFDAMKHKSRVRQKTETIKCLEKLFPRCFSRAKPKPLKLGIENDIMAALAGMDASQVGMEISKKKLQRALKYYVLNIAYKTAVLKSPFRFDLQGNPSGPVDLEHKADAQRWLAAVMRPKRATPRTAPKFGQKPHAKFGPTVKSAPHDHPSSRTANQLSEKTSSVMFSTGSPPSKLRNRTSPSAFS